MSDDKRSTSRTRRKLLTAKERDVCQKVAASDAGLASQRAVALLTINEGLTRAKASEQSGLKPDQIKYLMTTFRKKRLAMFPDDVLGDSQPTEEAVKKAKRGKKAKKTKAKKEKKTKKKAKGGKKAKKEKKTKKKTKRGKKDKKEKKAKKKKIKGKKEKKTRKSKAKKGKKAKKSRKDKTK